MATITPLTPPMHEVPIDEMVDETFPAGNRGAVPHSRIVEETVPLGDLGVVTLRFDGEFRHLHVYLGEEGMALDAKALDRLIAVLSAKRGQMQE